MNPIHSHLDIKITGKNDQLDITYSKPLNKSQEAKIKEKVTQLYLRIFQDMGSKEGQHIQGISFAFEPAGHLKVTLLKKNHTQQDFDMEGLTDEVEAVKQIEDSLIDAVSEISSQAWSPKKILDVSVLNKADHLDVFFSKNLAQQAAIKEKVTDIYRSVLEHLPAGVQKEEVEDINFAFYEGNKLKITLLKKDQTTISIDDALFAQEVDLSKQTNQVFDILSSPSTHVRKAPSLWKRLIYHFTVRPLIQKLTRDFVQKQMSEEMLKQVYIEPTGLYGAIKSHILVKAPQLYDLYGEGSLKVAVQEQLVANIQERLKELHVLNQKNRIQDLQNTLSTLYVHKQSFVNLAKQADQLQQTLNKLKKSQDPSWDELEAQFKRFQAGVQGLNKITDFSQFKGPLKRFEAAVNAIQNGISVEWEQFDAPLQQLQTSLKFSTQLKLSQAELVSAKSAKAPLWRRPEFLKLDALRVLHYLKTHPTEPHPELFGILQELSPLDIPVKELKKIAVTPYNQAHLALTWKHLADQLFKEGQLDQLVNDGDLKKTARQTTYAIAYLNLFHSVPRELKIERPSKDSLAEMRDFVIQKSQREMELDEPYFRKAQHIYKECILPVFEQMGFHSLDLIALVDCLTLKNSDLVEQFIQHVQEKQAQLPGRFKLYNNQQLHTILRNELEKIVIDEYHLTSSQLASIQEAREQTDGVRKAVNQYRTDIAPVVALKELLAEKKANVEDAQVELPKLAIPFHLANPDIQMAAIQGHFNGQIEKFKAEIAEIRKQLKGNVRRPKAEVDGFKKGITLREGKIAQIEIQKSNALLNRPDMIRSLRASLPANYTLESRYIDANQMSESDQEHLELLLKAKANLEPSSAYEIAMIEEAIDKIRSIQKDQAEIPLLEQEINSRSMAIKANLDQRFGRLSQAPLEALLVAGYDSTIAEPITLLWTDQLKKTFKAAALDQLPLETELTNTIKEQLEDYRQAKASFQKAASKSNSFGGPQKVQLLINELESSIPQAAIRAYLSEEIAPSSKIDANEILFGEQVLAHVSTAQDSYSTFSPEQQANMMFLNKVLNKNSAKQVLTSEEKSKLHIVLTAIRKDSSFKAQINRYYNPDQQPPVLDYLPPFLHGFVKRYILKKTDQSQPIPELVGGVQESTLKFIETYLGKMRDLQQMPVVEALIDKANILLEKDPTSPIEAKERLTIRELGILSRAQRLNTDEFIENLEKMGLSGLDPDFKRLADNYWKVNATLENLNQVLRPALIAHYKDGSLLAHSTQKKERWMGRAASSEERIISFVAGGFTHGAKIYCKTPSAEEITAARAAKKKDPQVAVYISQIWGEYEQIPLDLYELATSDMWAIDVAPLIDLSFHPVLEEVYGANWRSVINQMYQEIEQDLHAKGMERFAGITNNEERRLQAGFANQPWLANLIGKKDVRGHQRNFERDADKIYNKFFQQEPLQEEQICSEFASKSTMAAMVKLNKVLSQKMESHLGISRQKTIAILEESGVILPPDVKEYLSGKRYYKKEAKITQQAEQKLAKILKSQGITKLQIKRLIHLNNESILDLPYRKERMRAIHPGRMAQLLVKRGCATKLGYPPEATRLIDFESTAVAKASS
jgi:hypothetical protein